LRIKKKKNCGSGSFFIELPEAQGRTLESSLLLWPIHTSPGLDFRPGAPAADADLARKLANGIAGIFYFLRHISAWGA